MLTQMPPAAHRLVFCRELMSCQSDEWSDTAEKSTLTMGFNCSPPKSEQQLNCMQQNQEVSRMGRLGKQVWKQRAFAHRSMSPFNINDFLFLFPVTERWFFFLIISQLHIKNLYHGMVVKIIQQWCIFTVILIPQDTLNLVFSCIKLSHKTYSKFEKTIQCSTPASKPANAIFLSKTHWWVWSCWVQCHKNNLLTIAL